MSELNYEILEKRIHDWAVRQPKMQAGLVVGSRARQDYTMDEWSDLDLILFAHAREELASDGSWLEQFGEVWVSWLNINLNAALVNRKPFRVAALVDTQP